MDKKHMIAGGVGAVVLLGGTFYGGMAYGKSTASARGQFGSGQFAAVQFMRAGGAAGAARGGGGLVTGQILSKDANGITVKMADGSSKIVLLGSSTQISKFAAGSPSDLAVGANVLVTGSANGDGSVTAQSVQLRPAGAPAGTASRPQ